MPTLGTTYGDQALAKKLHYLTIVILLTLFSSTALGAARGKDKPVSSVSVTPTLGGYLFSSEDSLDPAPIYGLKISYDIIKTDLSDSLGIEGTVNYIASKTKDGSQTASTYIARADVLYSFTPREKFVPFLTVGAGGIVVDKKPDRATDPLFNYGIGFKYYLENYLALRMDLRHLLVYSDVGTRNNYELSTGLTYLFGKERKKQALVTPKNIGVTVPIVPRIVEKPAQPLPPSQEEMAFLMERLGLVGVAVLGISTAPPSYPQPAPPPEPGSALAFKPAAPAPQAPSPAPAPAPVPAPVPAPAPAPAPIARAEQPPKQEVKKQHRFIVEFDFAKWNIRPEYDAQLRQAAALIKNMNNPTVLVEGHTDRIGNEPFNRTLSLKRAASVKARLVKLGVAADRITITGYGFKQPVADNATAKGRQKNRRAVTTITAVTD